jgi:glycosyltransferase involved in cell wall biosynthesis
MKISGFSYVRNGIAYDYPFLESIQSILPICDEFVMVLGDSTDSSREAILSLNSDKIRIVDTVWDMNNRTGGKVFAQQANEGLDHITGDWAFHIQADEVIHERDLPKILDAIQTYDRDERVEGLLLPFIHFWGSYDYIRTSRKMHKNEIRVIRNNQLIRSYRDSQGFRKYSGQAGYDAGEKGEKLFVKKVDAPVNHYNGVRKKEVQDKKVHTFVSMYTPDMPVSKQTYEEFNFNNVDRVEKFKESHPAVMTARITSFDQPFTFDPKKAKWRLKDKLIQPIEDILGVRFGEYKNYRLLK